jgi:hypothetical protein
LIGEAISTERDEYGSGSYYELDKLISSHEMPSVFERISQTLIKMGFPHLLYRDGTFHLLVYSVRVAIDVESNTRAFILNLMLSLPDKEVWSEFLADELYYLNDHQLIERYKDLDLDDSMRLVYLKNSQLFN